MYRRSWRNHDHKRYLTVYREEACSATSTKRLSTGLCVMSSGCKVDGAKPLHVGDVCRAEARIVSATKARLPRWSLRRLHNAFPLKSTHASPPSPLSLPLILMVLGPALPLIDMWKILAQGATQTASLGKFSSLHHNGLLMSSPSSYSIYFVGMILHGDELTAKLRHTDMPTTYL